MPSDYIQKIPKVLSQNDQNTTRPRHRQTFDGLCLPAVDEDDEDVEGGQRRGRGVSKGKPRLLGNCFVASWLQTGNKFTEP